MYYTWYMYICRSHKGRWSSEGLKTVSVTRVRDTATVTCASSHLTSFAILVDVGGAQVCCYVAKYYGNFMISHTWQNLNSYYVYLSIPRMHVTTSYR